MTKIEFRILGQSPSSRKGKELTFIDKVLNTCELVNLNLINQLVSPEELGINAIELAHQIVYGPSLALGLTKKLLN